MLDHRDDARWRAVAATGTIDEDSTVGPVGGVYENAAVHNAGADLFLTTADKLTDVDEPDPHAAASTTSPKFSTPLQAA